MGAAILELLQERSGHHSAAYGNAAGGDTALPWASRVEGCRVLRVVLLKTFHVEKNRGVRKAPRSLG